jgi:osmoprotectant transport system ATP-binding protein
MIEIENLTKQYGSATVVDRVSISIARGSITVIVGTSGSGKSTLLRMINRLVEPTSGRVVINGRDTTTEPPHLLRRRIGYAIQGHGLFPHRTVAENIATVPRLLGWSAARTQARVEDLLKIFQLDPGLYASKFPHQLSGGQQQRVGVARAFAAEPTVLLMDEPFGALDEMTRDRLNEELLRLRAEQNWTAVFVTHSVAEAVFLSTRIIVLAPSPGRIAQEIKINLPFPRTSVTRESPEFESYVTHVSRALRGVHSA